MRFVKYRYSVLFYAALKLANSVCYADKKQFKKKCFQDVYL